MEATDLALLNRIEITNRNQNSIIEEFSDDIKNEMEEFERELNNDVKRFKNDIENTITSTLETIKDNNAILNVKDFGAIGNGIDDDRSVIEEAINHLKYTGGILRFPSGRYLLNSYSDDAYLTELWGQILPLYSNITISLDPGAEIILGDFFVDKKFILFNGYNEKEYNFTDCSNVEIIGGSIDFGGIGMISTITKRVGVAVGNGSNLSIENVTFKNGDLRNCIIAGDKTNNEYLFVNNCRFIDLVQDGVNNDFTAIYANMRRSKITNCTFVNTSRKGWEIGCCVELHQSDSVWSNSSVYKYARGCFLASSPTEGGQVERLHVHGINGVLNTELANFWCDDGCVLQIIKIHDNNIVSMTRDATMTNTLYYGVSCLTSTSCKPNSAVTGLTRFVDVYDNTLIVPTDNRNIDLSAMFTINNNATHIEDVSYYNNRCSVKNLCYTKGCEASQLKSFKIYDNTFEVNTMRSDVFGLFTFKSLLNCYIKISIVEPLINQMTYLLRFITTESSSGNTVIIEPQHTEKIAKPFMYDDVFIKTCKFEYPSNSTFIVTSATGVNSMYATADNEYIISARMISNNLPSTVFTCGSFIKNGSVLRTIVSINSDSSGNYNIRLLNSNLN